MRLSQSSRRVQDTDWVDYGAKGMKSFQVGRCGQERAVMESRRKKHQAEHAEQEFDLDAGSLSNNTTPSYILLQGSDRAMMKTKTIFWSDQRVVSASRTEQKPSSSAACDLSQASWFCMQCGKR